MSDGYIYFIKCGNDGPIKIGYSLNNVKKRLVTAQVYNPVLLTLMAVMKGSRSLEKELHQKFSNINIIGEWFKPEKSLLDYIKQFPLLNLTAADLRKDSPSNQQHCAWKGVNATDASKRDRAKRKYKVDKKKLCEQCKIKNQYELHHIDGNLDNIEPKNILKTCRRCSMELDGRLKTFSELPKPEYVDPKPCLICKQLRKNLRKGKCHSCNEYYRRNKKDKDPSKLDENGLFLKKDKVYKPCVVCFKIKHIKLKSGKCHACYEKNRRLKKNK